MLLQLLRVLIPVSQKGSLWRSQLQYYPVERPFFASETNRMRGQACDELSCSFGRRQ
jgi:hypothetical protein